MSAALATNSPEYLVLPEPLQEEEQEEGEEEGEVEEEKRRKEVFTQRTGDDF